MDGITVTGHGEATAVPDTLTADLGVAVLAPDVGTAFDTTARQIGAIISAITAAGVPAGDIQTRDLSVQPEYDHRSDVPALRGYRVSQMLNVAIRDVASAGAAIGAAASAGGDDFRVGGLVFGVDRTSDLSDVARAAAWADARHRAEHLARLAGVELGAPIAVTESDGGTPGPMPRMARLVADSMPLLPGTTAVTSDVTVTFGIVTSG